MSGGVPRLSPTPSWRNEGKLHFFTAYLGFQRITGDEFPQKKYPSVKQLPTIQIIGGR